MSLDRKYLSWPTHWLPNPQQDSWSFQPEDVRQATETEVGAIVRPQFETDVLAASCTLVLDQDQAAWFEAFERAAVCENLWFHFPVWYGGEIADALCTFKDRPKWTVEALTTTYTFSLLVQKRSLFLAPCAFEALDCWTPVEIGELGAGVSETADSLRHVTGGR